MFGLREWLGDRFHQEWTASMSHFHEERHGRSLLLLTALGVVVALSGSFAVLARAGSAGQISPGELATYATAVLGVASMRQFSIHNVKIKYGSAVMPTVSSLEQAIHYAIDPSASLPASGLPLVGVCFESVSFRYPGQEVDIYRDLDLDIPAGCSLAIVGANGVGKTTLVKLLARLHDPTSGRILVDGIDLAKIDPRDWQRRIGAVFQDFVHYELSVADNVGFGAVERTGDPVGLRDAAGRAGAAAIIDGLPAGWETLLSRQFQGGTELSGGEWQRVALARALFAAGGGARLLILDEPTAALDVRAEAAFYEHFLDITRGLTTILISHRFSTVRLAERIVVIEGGRVAESGSHDELLESGGEYARLFRLQASHFDEDPVPPDGMSLHG